MFPDNTPGPHSQTLVLSKHLLLAFTPISTAFTKPPHSFLKGIFWRFFAIFSETCALTYKMRTHYTKKFCPELCNFCVSATNSVGVLRRSDYKMCFCCIYINQKHIKMRKSMIINDYRLLKMFCW